jgi:hypothetical protein
MHLVHLFSFYRFHPQMSAHTSYARQSSLNWLPIFLRDFLRSLHSLSLQMNLFIAIHAHPYDIWWLSWLSSYMDGFQIPYWGTYITVGRFQKWKLPSRKGWIVLPPSQAISLYIKIFHSLCGVIENSGEMSIVNYMQGNCRLQKVFWASNFLKHWHYLLI